MSERWEYLTRFLWAHEDSEDARQIAALQMPGVELGKYAPEYLIPELNQLGDQGWELVHMQPIGAVGKNSDVGFIAGDAIPRWSNAYFCVFKRPRS